MNNELKEQFISELTADLDTEQEITLKQELEMIVDDKHPNLKNAVNQLTTKKYHKQSIGRWSLIGCLIVTSIAILSSRITNSILSVVIEDHLHTDMEMVPFNYTAEEQVLAESSHDAFNAKKLWESAPQNLGYFANYLLHSEEEGYGMLSYNDGSATYESNQLYKTAKQLDPDNSLYPFLITASLDGSVKQTRNYRKLESDIRTLEFSASKFPLSAANTAKLANLKQQIRSEKIYDILDTDKFNLAVQFLETGLAKSDFKKNIVSYQSEYLALGREKIEMNDSHSHLDYLHYFANMKIFRFFLSTHNIYCAHLERVCETKDTDKVKWLIKRYSDYLILSIKDQNSLIDTMFSEALIKGSLNSMLRAAKMIHWEDMVLKLENLQDALDQYDDKIENNHNLTAKTYQNNGVKELGRTANNAAQPVKLTSRELAQARNIEHAYTGRITSVILFTVLGLALLMCWLFRFVRNYKINSIILKVTHLITPKDWLLIITGSTILPLILFGVVIHSPEISIRKWSVVSSNGIPFIGQYTILLSLLIGFSVCCVRYIQTKRIPIRMKPFHWMHVAATSVSIGTLISLGILCKEMETITNPMVGIILLPIFYWSVTAGMFFFKQLTFEKYLINRTLIPVFGISMLGVTLFAFSLIRSY